MNFLTTVVCASSVSYLDIPHLRTGSTLATTAATRAITASRINSLAVEARDTVTAKKRYQPDYSRTPISCDGVQERHATRRSQYVSGSSVFGNEDEIADHVAVVPYFNDEKEKESDVQSTIMVI